MVPQLTMLLMCKGCSWHFVLKMPIGCFGHTINLCVKAGLNQPQVHTAIAHCSRLVTFFRDSSRAAHINKQDTLGSPKHILLRDVETRWNSPYDMVQCAMEQQAPICIYCSCCNRHQLNCYYIIVRSQVRGSMRFRNQRAVAMASERSEDATPTAWGFLNCIDLIGRVV